MKNLFKICLLLSVLIIPQVSHSLTFALPNPEDIEKVIDLDGNLGNSPEKSLFPKPVYATISSFELNAEVSKNLGDINIEVYSITSGFVFENNVNTQTQQYISINISDWDSGIYEIRFVNSVGNCLYGTFEIK
ncbi:DUF3244 domain-containing protein [Maribellus mangrovi]|uniref:DUF3244 domain-containing protein n=1 Tax=Maribellus mangrovi TaxID=3133146 RepID=UPI0030EBDB9F